MVSCSFDEDLWDFLDKDLRTCKVFDQAITDRDFTISSSRDESVEGFVVQDNPNVKFLPEKVAESFPQLVAYEVFNCSAEFVGENHFIFLNKLKVLKLSNNKIHTIEPYAFKDLHNLEEINLDNNEIEYLPEHLFESFGKLKNLFMVNNKILFLRENIFKDLTSVQNITLAGNELEFINENLFKFNKKLENVWIEGNRIKFISFDTVKNLLYVDLQKNFCIDDYFDNSGSITDMETNLKEKCIPNAEKANKGLEKKISSMKDAHKATENMLRNKLGDCEKRCK